jgi:hypothetical protein
MTQLNQFLKMAQSTACKKLPNGMVISLSNTLGFVAAGATGQGEAVFNFNSGQISLFGALNFQAGFQLGMGPGFQAGFIWELGQSNSNYTGSSTSVAATFGAIGPALASSSNGMQNPFSLSAPYSATIGVQSPSVTFACGEAYYTTALNIGNLSSTVYQLMFPEMYQYMQDYQSLCGSK